MEMASSSLSARELVVLQIDSAPTEEVVKATCEAQEVPRERKTTRKRETSIPIQSKPIQYKGVFVIFCCVAVVWWLLLTDLRKPGIANGTLFEINIFASLCSMY